MSIQKKAFGKVTNEVYNELAAEVTAVKKAGNIDYTNNDLVVDMWESYKQRSSEVKNLLNEILEDSSFEDANNVLVTALGMMKQQQKKMKGQGLKTPLGAVYTNNSTKEIAMCIDEIIKHNEAAYKNHSRMVCLTSTQIQNFRKKVFGKSTNFNTVKKIMELNTTLIENHNKKYQLTTEDNKYNGR